MTTKNEIKFSFFGTPSLAVDILNALENAGYVPSVIVTMPDRPQGRGMVLTETPVAAWGRVRDIPVFKPEKINDEFIREFMRHDAQFAIVVAYGKILPHNLLEVMPMFNIHYSLLPRWRGATPVESAILAGDSESGVALQRIVYKLDAGPIVAQEKTPIGSDETTPELRARLNTIAARLLVDIMPKLASGDIAGEEQNESDVTTCGKMSKEDGELTLSDDGVTNYRKYRAYAQWPRTYAFFERNGKTIRTIIVRAHLEKQKFVIDTVKPEGKGEMPYAEFVRSGAKPL